MSDSKRWVTIIKIEVKLCLRNLNFLKNADTVDWLIKTAQ